MSFTVKRGTPIHSGPLCHTCNWVHMQRGFRESEEIVFCNLGDLRPVPFPVRECSDYRNRTHPTWDQMEELALPIDGVSTYKPAGFLVGISGKKQDE